MNRRTWNRDLLFKAGQQFGLRGRFLEGAPYGSGHINDTFAVTYDQAGTRVRYILQRLNSHVFRDPGGLMENVALVCEHLASKLAKNAPSNDVSRRALTLVPTTDGKACWVDDAGDFWRTYFFIENAATHDLITSTSQAREAARAFGRFQTMLSDFPAGKLHETVPDFHNTPKRFEALREAVKQDALGRANDALAEIEFAFSHEPLAHCLMDLHLRGDIPLRTTHNDTKLNNVMLDSQTGEGICVIDLDTVMPGLSLYDFGDMVRTAVSPAAEDEQDLSKVRVRTEMFEALASGFLSSAGKFLNEIERSNLVAAGKLLTYENGIRFLTDYLRGDLYFKIKHPKHNLDRCRTQFQLIRKLEEQEEALQEIAGKIPV